MATATLLPAPGEARAVDYDKALRFLSQYTNYERELRFPYDGWSMNLERVRLLLRGLGDPDRDLDVIHIAGTKGKGSTAAMIESVMRAAGFRTGMFTSPHLLDFRERIKICGEMVDEETVAAKVAKIRPAAEKILEKPGLGMLTYFEVLTALALAAFASADVDVAILETGLGGRWDATNACDSMMSVLTPVSLDHMDILGDTLEKIAVEKSMIIKPGNPCVIAPQEGAVYEVFSTRCRKVGAPEVRVEDCYHWSRSRGDVTGQWFEIEGRRNLKDLFIPLAGNPQLINAATTVTVADSLDQSGFEISDQAIKEGFADLHWPGRFQRIRKDPDVILDGAHNAASAAHLRDTLRRLYPGRRVTAVLGMSRDKDVEGFCLELGPALGSVVITRSDIARAAEPARLRAALSSFDLEIYETRNVAEAMDTAMSRAFPDDVILVTGSFYIVGNTMEWDRSEGA